MKRIGIIGGTGWDSGSLKSTFPCARPETISTRWGNAAVFICSLDDREIVFLHRHISPEIATHLPPHRINYRANIAAFRELDVSPFWLQVPSEHCAPIGQSEVSR
jgi:purine nucleoside phosphorylase